jgi:lipopolysaccharide export system permease protein
VAHSKTAIFDGKNLAFENTASYELNHSKRIVDIQLEEYQQYNTQVTFDQELIASLRKEPHELSTWNLYKQISFLTNNNLTAKPFEVEFYKRIIKPITLIAMLLFSMLFIFGSLRDSSLGKKIFLGVMVSLFFELASRIGGMLSLRFDYNPLLSASIPTVTVLIIAFILLRRKSAR